MASHEARNNPRVAADVLHHDQRVVLFDGDDERDPPITPLAEPFDDRRDLINWWQAASVRTLGYLPDIFPAVKIVREDHLVDALVGPDSGGDGNLRAKLVERLIDPSWASLKDMETRANERLEGFDSGQDYTEISPDEQEHIGMRPAFTRLDEQQRAAMLSLWDGFDDRVALDRWLHELSSVADFSDVLDEPLGKMMIQSTHAREMFLTDSNVAQEYRERFASVLLLPAFAKRARQLRAGESISDDRGDSELNQA